VPLLSLRFFILHIGMLAAPTTLTIVETGRIIGREARGRAGATRTAIAPSSCAWPRPCAVSGWRGKTERTNGLDGNGAAT